jgi:hypothetical protein
MGDGEVRRENRHGIAEDQVFVSVEDSFLVFREMIQTEKTSPPGCIFFCHTGQAALDSSGIVLEADGKSPAGEIPLSDVLKQFVTFPKIQPRLFLL